MILVPEDFLEYLPDLHGAVNVFMTLTPLFSYGSTCLGIYKRRTSVGFSIDICATMLMAATLRILYYTIVPFEVTLLKQAVVMVFIQCILLKVSLKYRPSNYDPELLNPIPQFNQLFSSAMHSSVEDDSDFNARKFQTTWQLSLFELIVGAKCYVVTLFTHAVMLFDVYYKRPLRFWQWKEEFHYWRFIVGFMAFFSVLTWFLNNSTFYGNVIGLLGLLIESLLPLPQILLLERLKSVENFKIILLLLWLGGDLTKLSYLLFGAENISIMFVLAGLFQMSLDITIAYQYFYYKNANESPLTTHRGQGIDSLSESSTEDYEMKNIV